MTQINRITPDAQPDATPVPDNVDVTVSEDGKEGRAKIQTDNPAGDKARPEWLQEKFKTPEDLAKAYSELEKKMSTGEETPAEKVTEKVPDPQDAETLRIEPKAAEKATEATDFTAVAQEFVDNGELSAETYDAMEGKGIPRNVLDAYLAGQKAIAEKATTELSGVVGGAEQYKAVQEWAAVNVSADQLGVYNKALDAADFGTAKLLLAGIHAQFTAAGGNDPKLVSGAGAGERQTGAKPFASNAEQSAAINDARYQTDPVYRAQVEARIAVS